jgi:predicted PurR-regulated permease PerM
MINPGLQHKFFLVLLAAITLAFGAVLFPFAGAVFWGVILAVMFSPLQRRLERKMPGRPNLAAAATLLLILVAVILPVTAIATGLVREAGALLEALREGRLDPADYLEKIAAALPAWLRQALERLDLLDIGGLGERLRDSAGDVGQFLAPRAILIGQGTLQFLVSFGILLYLLFFLLRDGPSLLRLVRRALPLAEPHKRQLFAKFTTVARATVKGNIVVAAVQGALGGIALWALGVEGALLWAVCMAFLSLLPAIGAGLVWGPIAFYLFATGEVGKSVGLIAYGVIVIGLADNLLRPLLVGKDARMPDWLVLVTTVGGIALFGISGFVIGPLIAALFISCWDLLASQSSPGPDPQRDAGAEPHPGPRQDPPPTPAVAPASGPPWPVAEGGPTSAATAARS